MPRPELLDIDFDERPFTAAWELTRACALACLHCRAEAQPRRHPDELSPAEALRVVDELAELAPPVLVLTGGDPLMRPDVVEIAAHAVSRGFEVAVSPTATALTTRDRLLRLRDAGVRMVHVSLDGATPATHDAFRGFPGTFARSLRTLETLREIGMPAQVGTTVTADNAGELPEIAGIVASAGVRVWNLFFLVPTGRGRTLTMVDAGTAERTWEWLAGLAESAPFAVRTTAAPQYRRTVLRRARPRPGAGLRLTGAGYQLRQAPGGLATRGVNDGKGFMFIDHRGDICPSGFLQVPAGNVRRDRIADVYRRSPLFIELREPSLLRGRCGRCAYRDLCGGSRARAHAVNGSWLAEDPLCALEESVISGAAPGSSAGHGDASRPAPSAARSGES